MSDIYPRVCVCGSRSITNYEYIERMMILLLNKENIKPCEIVSGCARGPDKLGETYASKFGIPIKRFPAQWKTFGISAGYRRNVDMAEYSDIIIAFYDGESKGTGHMINICKEKNKKIVIVSGENYQIVNG